jgi:hypothetical protein
MAQLFPEDFQAAETERRFSGELATLLHLKKELSDQHCVFHGVHWTKVEDEATVYGEIDFLIVNPYGKILAIEQKETAIEKNSQGELVAIYKRADGQRKEKNIRSQVTRNIQSLRQEFSKRYKNQSLHIEHLLYLPTANLHGQIPASIALGRVVDASEAKYLPEIIRKILEESPVPTGTDVADALTVREFLSEKAYVAPQLGLLGNSAREMTTRLSSGLSEWCERLEFSPFRLWVQGTAGSGKTQLALKELRLAKANGQTAMYLCFNRPLVDAMKLSAPEPNNCMTFHELAELLAKQNGIQVNFQEDGVFPKLANYLVENISKLAGQVDVLVIDEGQDFENAWGKSLATMVKDKGRIIWLEDPSQDLYGRWSTDWPNWVKITSPVNYRSPQRIVSLMNALELTESLLEAGNGYAGMIPNIDPYQPGMEIEATENAIQDLIADGYAPESIAVLSFRGVSSSKLLSDDISELASLKIRKFTGYDNHGHALWSDGQLFVDTLFRFKGQCADAVVLSEIDFEDWNENVKKRLFVGLSRARLMATLVVTERVSALLDQKLGL